MNGVTEKQHTHELIERLPDEQLSTAVRFLEFMLLRSCAPWQRRRLTMNR